MCVSVIVSAQRPSHPPSESGHFRVCGELPLWGLSAQRTRLVQSGAGQPPVSPRPHTAPASPGAGKGIGDDILHPQGLGSDLVTDSDSQGLWYKEKPEPGNQREGRYRGSAALGERMTSGSKRSWLTRRPGELTVSPCLNVFSLRPKLKWILFQRYIMQITAVM